MTLFVEKNMVAIEKMLAIQERVLATPSDDLGKLAALTDSIQALRTLYTVTWTALGGQLALLHLEVTRCQLSANQIAEVFEKSKALGTQAIILTTFAVSIVTVPVTSLTFSISDETFKQLGQTSLRVRSRTAMSVPSVASPQSTPIRFQA